MDVLFNHEQLLTGHGLTVGVDMDRQHGEKRAHALHQVGSPGQLQVGARWPKILDLGPATRRIRYALGLGRSTAIRLCRTDENVCKTVARFSEQ